MDRLSRIKIGPHEWSVVYEESPKDDRGRELWGECRHSKHQIAIDTSAPPDRVRETMMHEIIHAIAHNTAAVRLKEREVVALSSALAGVLVDNPDFAALFLPTLRGVDGE